MHLPKKEAYVRVSGVVQGVGFRWKALQEAEALDVRGWIRNRPDGDVDATLQGEEDKVREMLQWMRKGPSRAVVRDMSVRWDDAKCLFDDFHIRRS